MPVIGCSSRDFFARCFAAGCEIFLWLLQIRREGCRQEVRTAKDERLLQIIGRSKTKTLVFRIDTERASVHCLRVMSKPLDFMKFLLLFLVAGVRRFFVVFSVVCSSVLLLAAVAEVGLTQKSLTKT